MHFALYLSLFARLSLVQAHSWIDNISQKDDLSNIGYTRGYAGHIDGTSSFLIQSNASSTTLCRANQVTSSYSVAYPMLTIPAGAQFVGNYSENGHVTKDALAPDNRPHPGTWSWFLSSTEMTTLSDAYAATLIATGDFDDGKCGEDATRGRAGPRQCQSIVTVPSHLQSGKYMLVWLWHFPKVEGVVEMYSSCMDITVTSNLSYSEDASANGESDIAASDVITDSAAILSSAVDNGASVTMGNIAALVPDLTSTSIQRTVTSTIYETTRVYTTIAAPAIITQSLNRLGDFTGSMFSVQSFSTRITTLSGPIETTRGTVTNVAHHDNNVPTIIVATVVEEAQQNPLEDANNIEWHTKIITTTVEASSTSTPTFFTTQSSRTTMLSTPIPTSKIIDTNAAKSGVNAHAVIIAIQEAQQNPLEDANNIAFKTTVVAQLEQASSRSTSTSTITSTTTSTITSTTSLVKTASPQKSNNSGGVDTAIVVAVVMVYQTAYVTVTAH